MSTHVFEEAINETSIIHNLFIQHLILHILMHWNPLESGDKTYKFICHINDSR
jgi:hypothetical protein